MSSTPSGPVPPVGAEDPPGDIDEVTDAVLTASRLLVAVSARSITAVGEEVTLPQFRMLVVLAGRGPLRAGALADLLDVHPSTATRMTDRLVGAGLIVRVGNPDNRREVIVGLTDAGRRLVDDATRRRRAEIAEIVFQDGPAAARQPGRRPAGVRRRRRRADHRLQPRRLRPRLDLATTTPPRYDHDGTTTSDDEIGASSNFDAA